MPTQGSIPTFGFTNSPGSIVLMGFGSGGVVVALGPFGRLVTLYVNPDDVILRMQLDKTLDGIYDVVSSGIMGAQLHMERIIGGELGRKTRTHKFHLDSQAFSGIQPGGVYRIEIPSGFIRNDPAVTVQATWTELGGGNRFSPDYEAADTSLYEIDYDRGYILMDAYEYGDSYIQITCETGFEDGKRPYPTTGLPVYNEGTTYTTGDKVVFNNLVYVCKVEVCVGVDPEEPTHWELGKVPVGEIPLPVYEAIISLVPMVFNANQTTNRSDEAQKQYRTATDHAELLLQDFVRTKGFSFRPL